MGTIERLHSTTIAAIQAAMVEARRGDFVSARQIVEQALKLDRDICDLNGLAGMFCCELGDFDSGLRYLCSAWDARPDVATTINLAKLLVQMGAFEDALAICNVDVANSDETLRLWKIRGYILQASADFPAAVSAYQKVVEYAPDDYESWNNLGNAKAAIGDIEGAILALEHAYALQKKTAPIHLNLAMAYINAGRTQDAIAVLQSCADDFPKDTKSLIELASLYKRLGCDEEALIALERAAQRDTDDVELQIKLGNEYAFSWSMQAAENAFQRAIMLDPSNSEAYLLLASLYEYSNRVAGFSALIADAEKANIDHGALGFIQALALRRENKFKEGLAILSTVPEEIEASRHAQLMGQFQDRLGNYDAAFYAFSKMNELNALDPSEPLQRAKNYRTALSDDSKIITSRYFADWRPFNIKDDFRSPIFLVGFPRSGTTLLDTMLMGHPNIQVMEEKPALSKIQKLIGGVEGIIDRQSDYVRYLRKEYFAEVNRWVDLKSENILIDKSPLHMNRVPIIRAIFPDAKFIFATRHPCDVVLSCYITNFRLNSAMSNFLNINNAAQFYSQCFEYWYQCCDMMPVNTYNIAYENLLNNTQDELLRLFEYMKLDWHDDALNHRKTAMDRGVITTASYAQVTEPLYNRAAGRWRNYRRHMEPVLPILQPWVEKLGYSL